GSAYRRQRDSSSTRRIPGSSPMAPHLYALFHFSHLVTRTQPSQLYVKTLADEFSRAKLGKYELVTHRDDGERTQVVLTRLPNLRLPPFLDCFTRMRGAVI